jgi:alpha-glucoside transport system ATP-binding protein
VGLKVNVGVRPEDLVATTDAALYTGHVDIVEALGEVTVLYFEKASDHEPVIAKLPGVHRDMRGTEVSLGADPAKVHLFSNGVSLLYR